jgi:hypothetical protein
MAEMDTLSTFLTASGLVTAVSLLLTQLWVRQYDKAQNLHEEQNPEQETWEVVVGLAWSLIAVSVGLVSIVFGVIGSLYSQDSAEASPVAIGVFVASLTMTGVGVLELLHGFVYKAANGKSMGSKLWGERQGPLPLQKTQPAILRAC